MDFNSINNVRKEKHLYKTTMFNRGFIKSVLSVYMFLRLKV